MKTATRNLKGRKLKETLLLQKEHNNYTVFWPGEFHGVYSPWGHKESDMTERLLKRDTATDLHTHTHTQKGALQFA